MPLQHFHDQHGEFITLERLLDYLHEHRLSDGRNVPLIVWGGAGIGKCLHADTQVVVNGALTAIGALWEQKICTPIFDGEGWWVRPQEKMTVASLDDEGSIVAGDVVYLYRQRVREQGRRVRLDDGSEIVMTNRHRLHGLNGWQQQLAVGDRVCVPSHIPFVGEAVDEDLLTLMAWQIAEGYENASAVDISQKDIKVLQRLRESAQRLGAAQGLKMNSMPILQCKTTGVPSLHMSSTAYRDHLIALGYSWGRRSADKRIPDFIVGADNQSLRLFLREYFAAEGCVNLIRNVEISSASEVLIQQLSLMLRRFGIWLRVSKSMKAATNGTNIKRPYWRGVISGNSLQRFREEIGIACPRKQKILDEFTDVVDNTNTEGIPVADLLLRNLQLTGLPRRRFGLDSTYYTGCKGTSKASATRALAAVGSVVDGSMQERFEASSFSHQNHVAAHQMRETFAVLDRESLQREVLNSLAMRLQREVFYAKVVEVEDVWLDEFVYDLEVAEYHNYVAGGMITHNTQQIKAYARSRDLELKVYHPAHDVTGADIVGRAIVDKETGKTTYAIPEFLPREGGAPGIFFIDELNRAPELVLAGLMEILGEGTISQSGWKMPSNWLLVAAANPSELGYQVSELDEAMVDRVLHYAPGWDAPAWAKWAQKDGNLSSHVLEFALANKQLIITGEAQLPLEIENKLRATPRSMEYFSALYESEMSEGMLEVIAGGILGRAAAEEFIRQHRGERALSFEYLLAGKYEPTLQGWIDGEANGDALISATTHLLVAGLVGRKVNEEAVRRLGYYLALIPREMRDEAWALTRRSAPDWLDALKDSQSEWTKQLQQRSKSAPGGRDTHFEPLA